MALAPMGAMGATALLALVHLGVAVRQQWATVFRDDRERLRDLLRRSGGEPRQLSWSERRELRKLLRTIALRPDAY